MSTDHTDKPEHDDKTAARAESRAASVRNDRAGVNRFVEWLRKDSPQLDEIKVREAADRFLEGVEPGGALVEFPKLMWKGDASNAQEITVHSQDEQDEKAGEGYTDEPPEFLKRDRITPKPLDAPPDANERQSVDEDEVSSPSDAHEPGDKKRPSHRTGRKK